MFPFVAWWAVHLDVFQADAMPLVREAVANLYARLATGSNCHLSVAVRGASDDSAWEYLEEQLRRSGLDQAARVTYVRPL
jgi:hypothetical protein